MSDYTQETESELSSLSHTLGAHMRALDSVLKKGENVKPKLPKPPKKLKAKELFSLSGLLGAFESAAGLKSSSSNYSGTSSGQSMADLASAIQKSIQRDL